MSVAAARAETNREIANMNDINDSNDIDDELRWFVGIDWATEEHQVSVLDAAGKIIGARKFKHSGTGLGALCDWLVGICGDAPPRIGVAIEVPHGPVVETLLERGFRVHAINPKQLDRFRDRFSLAGAKDDRRDSLVQAHALRTDRQHLRRLQVSDPTVIELREASRMAEELQQDRLRLTNRMRQQLWRYYPQALELTDDLDVAWFLELWRLAPTPDKAKRVRESSVAGILKKHRVTRVDAAGALRILRQPPLTVAPGTSQAATAHLHSLIERLRLVNRQRKQVLRRIDALCARLAPPAEAPDTASGQQREQRDVDILRSLPGIGRIILATLLSEADKPLQARDYQALRALSGVAPVTRRSGKRCKVVMRRACHRRLRVAVYHWARVAEQKDPIYRARYQKMRQRGHSHARALRTIGDRLLYVACTMLTNRTLYDPNHGQLRNPA